MKWGTLEGAGIDRSALVTLHLKNVTLRQALDHILDDAGGGTVAMAHVIDGGAIVVTTEEDTSRSTKTVAYDVRDLINPEPGKSRQDSVDRLVKVIETVAVPQSWTDNGGTVGTISELNGKLVIQQTSTGHEKVAELLKLLKDERPAANTADLITQGGASPLAAVVGGPRGGGRGRFGDEGGPPPTLVGAAGQPQFATPRTVVSDEQIETANRAAIQLLHKKIPEAKFDNVPLTDVFDFCRDVSSANLFANWSTLEAAGIDKNSPVILHLKDATLETVLTATLRQLKAQHALAMVIDQGVITITTQFDLPGYLVTKTYDVTDLIRADSDITSLVTVMQSLTMTQEGGISVQSFGTKLIITAVPNSHEQVEKLLTDLRNKPTTQPAPILPKTAGGRGRFGEE